LTTSALERLGVMALKRTLTVPSPSSKSAAPP
jgi:hypothetical protein